MLEWPFNAQSDFAFPVSSTVPVRAFAPSTFAGDCAFFSSAFDGLFNRANVWDDHLIVLVHAVVFFPHGVRKVVPVRFVVPALGLAQEFLEVSPVLTSGISSLLAPVTTEFFIKLGAEVAFVFTLIGLIGGRVLIRFITSWSVIRHALVSHCLYWVDGNIIMWLFVVMGIHTMKPSIVGVVFTRVTVGFHVAPEIIELIRLLITAVVNFFHHIRVIKKNVIGAVHWFGVV
jgi:hypothetical protein